MSKPKFELWLSHTHQFILNLIYRRNMSTKIDTKEWVGIKTQSSYFPPLFPKKKITDNSVVLYLELQHSNSNWKH